MPKPARAPKPSPAPRTAAAINAVSATTAPAAPSIDSWLRMATQHLAAAGIPSARLDAELLLAHTLRRSRTSLHAHLDDAIAPERLAIADARLQLRSQRVPLAYIIGHKEFYGRLFRVTPQVLVPRPESEAFIELLAGLPLPPGTRVLDIGTGSGVLGITAQLEHPQLRVSLYDTSKAALAVAKANCQLHGLAEMPLVRQNLLQGHVGGADIIMANLPYVSRSWQDTSPELAHEPAQALYAGGSGPQAGLDLIYQLLPQAAALLAPGGVLLLEADTSQHAAIINQAAPLGFTHTASQGLVLQLVRQ